MANHPRGLERLGKQVFRWHKGGRLFNLLSKALTVTNSHDRRRRAPAKLSRRRRNGERVVSVRVTEEIMAALIVSQRLGDAESRDRRELAAELQCFAGMGYPLRITPYAAAAGISFQRGQHRATQAGPRTTATRKKSKETFGPRPAGRCVMDLHPTAARGAFRSGQQAPSLCQSWLRPCPRGVRNPFQCSSYFAGSRQVAIVRMTHHILPDVKRTCHCGVFQ